MLAVMRDRSATKRRRDDMARAAAPFVHPKATVASAKDAEIEETDEAAAWRELLRASPHRGGRRHDA